MLCFMDTDRGLTGPINVGNPEEITILELAKSIVNLTKSMSKIVFKPLPLDDPERRKPDISKAQKYLGWEPTILLEEGLIRMIEYYKEFILK